ncbi:MAG: hypothetical protein K2G04_09595 [Oscillospiraceae bacterium]|nr:hypothetical protein [Oscillospiraceae bacterium]
MRGFVIIYARQHFGNRKSAAINDPNEDGHEPITEMLIDGDIEVVEILKEINANIKEE